MSPEVCQSVGRVSLRTGSSACLVRVTDDVTALFTAQRGRLLGCVHSAHPLTVIDVIIATKAIVRGNLFVS